MRTLRYNSMAMYQKPLHIRAENGNGLRGLFEEELKDLFWAERALTRALPKLLRLTTSAALESILKDHLDETEEQVTRLIDVFSTLGLRAQANKCEGMEALLREMDIIINETEEGKVRDAAIIMSCQKIDHYEIASYNTLCSYAKILGEEEVLLILEESLLEEKSTLNKLGFICSAALNQVVEPSR